MAYTINNNFNSFKEDFKKDTGIEFSKDNMALYIAYIQARSVDNQVQLLAALFQEISNLKRR